MRVLVTGANGMLGKEFRQALSGEPNVTFLSKDLLDISGEFQVKTAFETLRPNLVINCAAFTNVDACERGTNSYFANALGPALLAENCRKFNSILVHFSTDYVFSTKTFPPFEFDKPVPINAYGRSKASGEWAIKHDLHKYFIIRTAGLFGDGHCFPSAIMSKARLSNELSVVSDQTTAITHTQDLVKAALALIATEKYGTYHFTNTGEASWADVAREVLKINGIERKINDISHKDSGRIAKRPDKAVLNCQHTYATIGWIPPSWQDALRSYYGHT